MKIEYICHSCLYVQTDDGADFVFDPWFNGPAYLNRWFVFPRPVKTNHILNTQNIIISHGHEDHLHAETLKLFNKNATVYFPFQWRDGAKESFNNLGFDNVVEAISFRSYKITENTKLTYIGFALESVIVIESKGEVFINLNDALNSHHQKVVDMFIDQIKSRWKKIDYLFSGWSGAGYFPNCVHYKDKDDVEVGKLREQYFANHLCKIVKELKPEIAVPYAPGFVLLDKEKGWINEIKFPREELDSYYKTYYDKSSDIFFPVMHPGDFLENKKLYKQSPYHSYLGRNSINDLMKEQYQKEFIESNLPTSQGVLEAKELLDNLIYYLNNNRKIYDEAVLNEVKFSIFLKDVDEPFYFNIHFEKNKFIVIYSEHAKSNDKLIITTTLELLKHSLAYVWGGDVLTIGYGLDVEVLEEDSLEKNLDIVCVRLITRYPRASDYLFKQPMRSLKYLISNPLMTKLAVNQKLKLRNTTNKFPYNERDHWISYTKCELCQVCNMPLLDFSFGESIKENQETADYSL